jgi:hypothetical protein
VRGGASESGERGDDFVSLSGGRYSEGGSLYTATLNAVQSMPDSARLTLLFETPARSLSCKSVTKNISYLSIAKLGPTQALQARAEDPAEPPLRRRRHARALRRSDRGLSS